jgi:glycerol-3-phosphate dehydrogenase
MHGPPTYDAAVIGGGVVGCAVALALARRGADTVLLEAEDELGLWASGTNSGILHTGFDSTPGELETRLIRRSAELRDPVLDALGVPVIRCGATLRPRDDAERARVTALAEKAGVNGVEVALRDDGALDVPGESVTDPVAYTRALAAAAEACGAQVRRGERVTAVRRTAGGLEVGGVACKVAVNCAGLFADEVARLAGDDSFEIYPRKGEFFVFDGIELDRILLPIPTRRTKGVLVFPTLDGKVVAGPTAVDQTDKEDWSVRPEALTEVRGKAAELLPAIADAEPIGSWAGLRPAGRGVNYLIRRASPELVNVAAIRSTGLTASLGIGEHVTALLGRRGVALGPSRALAAQPAVPAAAPWWRRTAQHRARVA